MQAASGAGMDPCQDFTQPQFLRAASGQHRGVLLIHGFTGSPYEMHLLAQRIHAAGYHCALPRLAGHHDTLSALSATRWPDWLASAEAALHALQTELVSESAQPPRIAVVGLSMGGLLTLDLARRYPSVPPDKVGAASQMQPQIVAISTLAMPLFLPPRSERAIRRFARTPGLRALAVPKLFGADIRETGRPRPPLKPLAMPVVCLDSLLDLMARVRAQLAEVHQPALLMHGMHDHTAPYASLTELARGLGTAGSQLHSVALPHSYHLLPLDVEREIVFDEVIAHLCRYL